MCVCVYIYIYIYIHASCLGSPARPRAHTTRHTHVCMPPAAVVAARACVEEGPAEVEQKMLQGAEAGAEERVLELELEVQKLVFEPLLLLLPLLRLLRHFGVRKGRRGRGDDTVQACVDQCDVE
jgi:hypothetical protein